MKDLKLVYNHVSLFGMRVNTIPMRSKVLRNSRQFTTV